MMTRAKRTSNRRPGAVARLTQKVNQLTIQTHGTNFTPAANPPGFTEIPWNHWTFQKSTTNSSEPSTEDTITVGDIITQIRNRLNISEDGVTGIGNIIKIRVLDVQAWCAARVSSSNIPDLKMRVFELNPGDILTARTTMRDIGTLNMPAKLGYKFPVNDSKQILSDADEAIKIAHLFIEGQAMITTQRCHVLWKSTFTAEP